MKNLIFLLASVFLFLPLSHRASVYRDTCSITNTKIATDIKSKDILGVQIDFDYFLQYDVKHKKQEPLNFIIEIDILDHLGKQLHAVGSESSFNRKGFAGAEKTERMVAVRTKTAQHFFVPYYCFDLPPGQTPLQVSIRVTLRDSAFDEKPRIISTNGTTSQSFTISKPPTCKVRMLCSGVRVSETDHGKNWDFGLSGLPDPMFKIILDNDIQPDFIYNSSSVENSLSAAWIDFSVPFLISEGDKITMGIYDKDTLIDDLIGKESHTLDEWLDISKASKELVFDQVKHCTVKVEKVK